MTEPHDVTAVRQELVRTRLNLHADQLVSMKNRRPRLEKEFPSSQHFMFSIDGELNGSAVRGALFGGSCILVRAKSFERAYALAKEGMEHTVELLYKKFEQRTQPSAIVSPIDVDFKDHPGERLPPHQRGIIQAVLTDKWGGKK